MDFVDTEKYIFKNEESHFFSMIFEMDAHTIQKCFHYENWIMEIKYKIYICIWQI